MTTPEAKQDPFLDTIMKAIVDQFFTALPFVDVNGYPQQRGTPVQLVVEKLFQQRQGELLVKIMDKIDLDDLAEKIATSMATQLLAIDNSRWRDPDTGLRQKLREKAQDKLADLLAKQMLDKMNAEVVNDAE